MTGGFDLKLVKRILNQCLRSLSTITRCPRTARVIKKKKKNLASISSGLPHLRLFLLLIPDRAKRRPGADTVRSLEARRLGNMKMASFTHLFPFKPFGIPATDSGPKERITENDAGYNG